MTKSYNLLWFFAKKFIFTTEKFNEKNIKLKEFIDINKNMPYHIRQGICIRWALC